MTRSLRLASNLALPLDTVTQTIAVLAKRRAGKSYTMRRLVEQLFQAGQQIVIVDPKGDQWGVRSAADGKGPGLAIVILGGERGDVPLEPSGGEVVAKLVVEERVSVLLDISLFRKHEVATFMTAFLEELYRLKAREIYRTPMMLVIDEADAIAPQKPQKGEERMLGAAEDLVRRGGQRGIGCVLVTQRSAVLNKNVLTQAQMLVAMRTIAPQDLAAMNAWIDVHGTLAQKQTLMESLPSLPIGDAWFWSPGWPTPAGIFKRVHVLPIETFDSGATPKSGEKRVEPKKPADVDLKALTRQMAATIEKAKADDPRELRKQLAEVKRELAKKEAVLAEVDVRTKRIDEKLAKAAITKRDVARAGKIAELQQHLAQHRRALEAAMKILVKVKAIDFAVETNEDRKALEQAVAAAVRQVTAPIEKRVTALATRVEGFKLAAKHAEAEITALLDETIDLTVQVQKREPFHVAADRPASDRIAARPRDRARVVPVGAAVEDRRVSTPKGELKKHVVTFLTVFAQHPDGLTREQAHILAGYVPSGDTSTAFGAMLDHGWIGPTTAGLGITAAGLEVVGPIEPLPTGAALREHLLARLSSAERKMLSALFHFYAEPTSRTDLHTQAGLKPSGDTSTALGKFLKLGWALERDGGLVAAETFFES